MSYANRTLIRQLLLVTSVPALNFLFQLRTCSLFPPHPANTGYTRYLFFAMITLLYLLQLMGEDSQSLLFLQLLPISA